MTEPDDQAADETNATPETVLELHPGLGGRWLVTTRGSQHVWDLDRMTYQRLPGSGRSRFAYDAEVVSVRRVGVWPKVGASSLVFFDDPQEPDLEQWRASSTISSIARLPAFDGEPER